MKCISFKGSMVVLWSVKFTTWYPKSTYFHYILNTNVNWESQHPTYNEIIFHNFHFSRKQQIAENFEVVAIARNKLIRSNAPHAISEIEVEKLHGE